MIHVWRQLGNTLLVTPTRRDTNLMTYLNVCAFQTTTDLQQATRFTQTPPASHKPLRVVRGRMHEAMIIKL